MARYVPHALGPVVSGAARREHDDALLATYRSCLDLAALVEDIRTIAFCSVSTGASGFPRPRAAAIALRAVAEWTTCRPGRFDVVVHCVLDAQNFAVYQRVIDAWDGGTPPSTQH
ncbi:hypothetical protein GCM10022267_75520 [Lentzea roselyniae]|uniref:Macro domain-containing protein n=1 Tax=Lentzea roselyniae TaxID=531940 RepID=A0ABP7C6Y3_9PSEU